MQGPKGTRLTVSVEQRLAADINTVRADGCVSVDPVGGYVPCVAVVFIFSTTYLAVLGAKESSRATILLTLFQFSGLAILASVLFFYILQNDVISTAESFSWTWFDPFSIPSPDIFLNGFLIALFLYYYSGL